MHLPTLPKDAPQWANELFLEIENLKKIIDFERKKKENSFNYYDFINNFRTNMQADVANNYYPEVVCNGKRIGVTFSNLLYDKDNGDVLPKTEAFIIYKILYAKNKNRRYS